MKTFTNLSSAGQELIDRAIRARVNERVARDGHMRALANEHRGEEYGLLSALSLVEHITFAEAYALEVDRIIASNRAWLLEDAA